MTQIKRSLTANFAGKLLTSLLNLAFIPVYIKLIGMEAYGLIGFIATLQNMLPILDLGLSTTINRELAQHYAQSDDHEEPRSLIRTLEVIYWSMAGLIALALLMLAPIFAAHWIKTEHLSTITVTRALLTMSFCIALQFPFDLYAGGMQGLQRQVQLNSLLIAMSAIRAFGMILILRFVSPTIEAYCLWQTLIACMQTLMCACLLWRGLPAVGCSPRFQMERLRRVARFAAGISATSILGIILAQSDKLVLSRLLPLETFGYYALSSLVAMSLMTLIGPIFNAMFPIFSRLAVQNDLAALKVVYHRGCQLMSVVLLPCAIVIALFSREVMFLWTGNPITAERTHLLVSLLAVGMALDGLMNLPYALQLAYGWTQLAMWYNLSAVVIVVPAIFVTANLYGAIGAAIVWIVLNASYVFITLNIMHRRILIGEQCQWYLQDVGLPLISALIPALLARRLYPVHTARLSLAFDLAIILGITLFTSILLIPQFRLQLWNRIAQRYFVGLS